MNLNQKMIAHVRKSECSEQSEPIWIEHSLIEHLQKVAEKAKQFAHHRGAMFAEKSGLLHDLGKFQAEWQNYLKKVSGFEKENAHIEDVEQSKPKKIPHSTAGAKHAFNQLTAENAILGGILAYLIAGHHAGLADWYDKGSLKGRLGDKKTQSELENSLKGLAECGLSEDFLSLPANELWADFPKFLQPNFFNEAHIWIRFLFSCLVDADFLDTEQFMKGDIRPKFPSLDELHSRYECYMNQLSQNADLSLKINQQRQSILKQCFQAAEIPKNLFSLTVPTGGGKTLASLGFALKHALKFGKKRIIYAIPFTSIIEQNANVFRKVLGDDVVLEHHSNLDVSEQAENAQNRLATENWDAPLIVTTNVQLFESLFSAKTSRCRKIHNIADSVIILDEAQQIPREFFKPITDMIRVLARDYGVTFVLCTATQPELGKKVKPVSNFVEAEGLSDIHEIIQDKNELANALKRVFFRLPANHSPKQSWQEIADEIAQKDCVLAIVNTRRHARELFAKLPENGIKLHLSANMCANHRAEVIAFIRACLEKYRVGELNQPLWVVSTQLIEAGVDLDFPVVYRAMAGLDSIAQSAGRCNREGKLSELGEVVVFRAEQGAPTGNLKQGQDITEEMLLAGLLNDPLSPSAFSEYFKRFNVLGDWDKYGICDNLTVETPTPESPLSIKFRTASEKFRLIDNKGVSLIVPFVPLVREKGGKNIIPTNELDEFFKRYLDNVNNMDNVLSMPSEYRFKQSENMGFIRTDNPPLPEPFEQWFNLLESDPLSNKWVYKKLQRFTINVYESELKKFPKEAIFERAGLLVLSSGSYHDVFGANCIDDVILSPEQSVL